MKMDLESLREWMAAMRDFGMAELTIEEDGSVIHLRREEPKAVTVVPAAAPQPVTLPQAAPSPAAAEPQAEPEIPEDKIIKSPVVGVFYAAPGPDRPPFVKPGDEISEGDCLCIVEAMKLMNEVLAPRSGRIKEILVSSGQKVEYGQKLMILE